MIVGLARVVAEAPEGERNSRLYWAARRLMEGGIAGRIDVDLGNAVLRAAARETGLGDTEIERTLTSAARGTLGAA